MSRVCRAVPSSQWPRSGSCDGLTADDGRWSGDDRTGRFGKGGVSSRLASPPRVARANTTEDLAEALEGGDGAGRQEVVDVRIGRAHPAGERLVAGRPGQRVEPHETVAIPAQPR